MYCPYCGNKIEDNDSAFCGACGKALGVNPSVTFDSAPDQSQKNLPSKNRHPKLLFGAVIVIVIAIMILAFIIFQSTALTSGYNNPEKVVDVVVNAMHKDFNVTKMIKSMPKEYLEYMEIDKNSVNEIDEEFKELKEGYNEFFGKNYKVTYEISDQKEYTNQSEIEDMISELDIDDISKLPLPEKLIEYKVSITITPSNDSEETEDTTDDVGIFAGKINDKWYFIPFL